MQTFDLLVYRQHQWSKLNTLVGLTLLPWDEIANCVSELNQVDYLWAFPGQEVRDKLKDYFKLKAGSHFKQLVTQVYKRLDNHSYRMHAFSPLSTNLSELDQPVFQGKDEEKLDTISIKKPCFEVLVIHPLREYETIYKQALAEFRTDRDEFLYDVVFVTYADQAVAALLANPSIQVVIMVSGFETHSPSAHEKIQESRFLMKDLDYENEWESNNILALGRVISRLRPEVCRLLVGDPGSYQLPEYRTVFQRILYQHVPFQDAHYSILNAVRDRFSTPFFHALQTYSKTPKKVFHALPVSQGTSLQDSPWTKDLLEFYGPTVFGAETSSTQGGLDSLLDPKGAIKQAQDKAAIAFGAQKSFFVTNGTSTANKIVLQTTLKPGDVVLVASDCHKSIPYGVVLAGAFPIFVETPVNSKYDLSGTVVLDRILEILNDLKKAGKLHLVKQISLTNSTFDGLLVNVEQIMLKVLAIKPDIIFHWDEAWFAFGYFNPLYQTRCAMAAVQRLKIKHKITTPIRVYVTQSTHKTLTSFRQGSMLHIYDEKFHADAFWDAYRMHTTTSPNYQILASLDVGRRQVSLEGYGKIQNTLFLAGKLRDGIENSETLKPYFKVLSDADFKPSTKNEKTPKKEAKFPKTFFEKCKAWETDDFVVDPTRITVDIRGAGMDGFCFKELLMSRYNIQVNKTSLCTVLFIVNIGTTQASIDYLLGVLHDIAESIAMGNGKLAAPAPKAPVQIPQHRKFSDVYRPFELKSCHVSDIRKAFYDGLDPDKIEYLPLTTQLVKDVLNEKTLVSAGFVTPYPPGYPMLMPGQVITYDILMYLHTIKNKEIHGYRPSMGLKVFKESK